MLISHEDGLVFAFNSGHWKSYIRAIIVDSVTSDAFKQDGLPFAACALAHVQLVGCVDGAVTNSTLVKNIAAEKAIAWGEDASRLFEYLSSSATVRVAGPL
jgi:hypothetical protein